jgi:RND family efflux transporter MFP subunit
MSRRRVLTFAPLVLAAAAAAGCERPQPELPPARPPDVIVGRAVTDYVTDYEDFTGRTDAIYSVEVRARVTGYLEKVQFKDGDEVKEGDLLFEIDARPYKAQLDQTEATLAQNEAHLTRLTADYKRAENLYRRGSIGREEFDKYTGDRSESEAAVGIARAQYDMAKLNYGFTKVTAQISGRLSRRLVDPGNLVTADTTALTTIVSLDPMYVYFDIDERTLLRLRRMVQEGKLKTRQEKVVPVLIGLSDEEGYSMKGTIDFSDNRVDAATGTLRVRARVPNPRPYVLSPGLFVRVRVPIGDPHRSVLVEERSVGTDQGQKFVYVVSDKNQVETRRIKVGRLDGIMRVVAEGLAAGERVVVNGIQRIRPGITVTPHDESESERKSAERSRLDAEGRATGKAPEGEGGPAPAPAPKSPPGEAARPSPNPAPAVGAGRG